MTSRTTRRTYRNFAAAIAESDAKKYPELDPTEARRRMCEIANLACEASDNDEVELKLLELSEIVLELDKWILDNGELPAPWRAAQVKYNP